MAALNDISRDLNKCVFIVDRASGYSRFHGAFPVHSDFPVEKSVHEQRRSELPWPDGGEATVELSGFWPEANEHTVVPQTHPGPGLPDPGPEVQQRLRSIRDQLNSDEHDGKPHSLPTI